MSERKWVFPRDEEAEELIQSYDQLKASVANEPAVTWWRRLWWWLTDFPGWWNG